MPFPRTEEWSLATRVILSALVLLAVLFAIEVVVQGNAARERRAAEVRNAADAGQAIAGIVDGFASDLETTTLAMAAFIGSQQRPIDQASVGPYLRSVSDEYGMLRGLFVTSPDGRVLAGASGEGIGTELASRPYMQKLRGGAATVWGDGVAGIQSGDVTLTYGREVRGTDGQLRGYLVAAFYPPKLTERLRMHIPDDADVSMIDARGLLLDSTRRPKLSPDDRNLGQSPQVQAALRGDTVRLDGDVGYGEDRERFGVIRPVPTTGWAVAYTRPLAPLNAVLRNALLWQLGLITLAVLFAGAVLAFTTRRLTRPLAALAGSAAAIARGERPPAVEGFATPEVRQLAEAMSAMSAAVTEREDALRQESERRTLVADASRAFAESVLDLNEELATVVRRVSESIGDGCSVFLLTEDRNALELAAIHHPDPEALAVARGMLAAPPLALDRSVLGQVARTGRSEVISVVTREDYASDLQQEYRAFVERFSPFTLAGAALQIRGEIIGVLSTWRETPGPAYTSVELGLLEEIADRAALAIQNARLFKELDERSAAVQRSLRVHSEAVTQLAHDLKNPLTVISSTAQLVERQLRNTPAVDSARVARQMTSIRDAINKVSAEIDASTDLARWQSGEPVQLDRAPVDLVALLGELVSRHQQLSEAHELTLTTAVEELVGAWDGPRLERAFGNLLSNAMKYSPEGGAVHVSLAVERSGSREWAEVSVRDEGIGIPPDAVQRIFERFYRAPNVEGFAGTGLGLNGVQHIVQAHDGTVDVASTVGTGTTLTIRLPIGAIPAGA